MDGVGGRTLDIVWASIFNEENDEDSIMPRSGKNTRGRGCSKNKGKDLVQGYTHWLEKGPGSWRAAQWTRPESETRHMATNAAQKKKELK